LTNETSRQTIEIENSNGTKVTIISGEQPSLKELQDLVGGYIELVHTPNKPYQVLVDEEGQDHWELHPNSLGTAFTDIDTDTYPILVGPVVILVGDARMT